MALSPSRPRLGLLLLLVTASFAVVSVPTARVARAGWWDDLDKGEQLKLSDLTADADRWKGKVVTFACIYHAPDSVYQPYFTSFNAEKFLNFTAWYDGAPIWEKRSFLDDEFPYLYLPRNHAQRDELLRIPSFTRIEVTGKVKDVYRQRPWIEVLGFRVTPATFGQKVVDDMKDGDAYAANGDYVRAEGYYRRVADQVALDDVTRLRVTKRLAEARRAAGMGLEPSDAGKVLGGTTMPQPGDGNGAAAPALPIPDDVPGAVRVAPPADAGTPSTRPDALTTDDLPGTPIDNTKPGPVLPRIDAPALPARRAPGSVLPAPVPVAPGATLPAAKPIAPPPAPTASTAPAASDAPAGSPPPPPPPRTPRLSGVK